MQRVQRGRWAPLHNEGRHYDKTFTTALTGKENQANRAFGAMKILSPFGALRHHLSPSSRGHYGYCKLCHMTSRESVEQFIFPRNRCGKRTWFVGERYRPENQMKRFPVEKYRAAGIGVHFQRAKPGFTVFAAKGSAAADRRHLYSSPARAIPPPSEPSEPSEPFEPSEPRLLPGPRGPSNLRPLRPQAGQS